MKLALLGTGMIVTEVLPVLTTIEGIELEAIMSTPRSLDKAEALAKQYGLIQATSDYERFKELRNCLDVIKSRRASIGVLFHYSSVMELLHA